MSDLTAKIDAALNELLDVPLFAEKRSGYLQVIRALAMSARAKALEEAVKAIEDKYIGGFLTHDRNADHLIREGIKYALETVKGIKR